MVLFGFVSAEEEKKATNVNNLWPRVSATDVLEVLLKYRINAQHAGRD